MIKQVLAFYMFPTLRPHLGIIGNVEVHGYCMEGNTWIGCGETGQKLTIEPGDKLVIPSGALHIEGESDGPVTYVVTIPDTRSHAEAFQLLPPDHPGRPLD